MAEFNGKVAFVTGGASGIGLAIAEECARRGADVAIASRRLAPAKQVAERLTTTYSIRAIGLQCDVSDNAQVEAAIEETLSVFGRLDYAVNSAGNSSPGAPFHEYSVAEFKSLIGAMLKSEGGKSIVNIGSTTCTVAIGPQPAYVSAKHGIVGLAKVAAAEYTKQGIRINTLGVGFTHTPLLDKMAASTVPEAEDPANTVGALAPIGRAGKPEEVANVACFLLSDDASFVSGALVNVDGGFLVQGRA